MTRKDAIKKVRWGLLGLIIDKDVRDAFETLIPELRESEDEKAIKLIRSLLVNVRNVQSNTSLYKQYDDALAWLEKQKEQKEIPLMNGDADLYFDNWKQERQGSPTKRECFNEGIKYAQMLQKEQKPILEVFGFKVGDAVRLKDGDGRKHIIKSFEEVEGIHGPNFYHVEFEDNSARDGIYPGEEYPNGYYTQMEKFEKEQKPTKWTDLTWKDIVELEGIINNVHYDFSAGIGQKSFGKEVLERFREYKGEEYLDEKEQKPAEWSEEDREEDIQTRFAFYTYKDDPSTLYLSNVFVEEASRNHGFGTRILKAAEKAAEAVGATTISLKVKQDSPANAWYRKRGYGYVAFEDGYDWLEKNLEYMKPNIQE